MGKTNSRFPSLSVPEFEVMLHGSEEETDLDPLSSYMRDMNNHIPSGFCTYTTFAYGEVEDPMRLYRGKDCIEVFCDHISEEAKKLCHMFPEKLMEPLTP